MGYKRMLFDAAGVSLGHAVGASQLLMGTRCLERLLVSLLTHFWEQETWAFCSQLVPDSECFVREGFFVCFVVKQC